MDQEIVFIVALRDAIITFVSGSMVKQEEYTKQMSDVDVEHNSLPSADDGSSGYESFKMFKDNDRWVIDREHAAHDGTE